MESIHGHKVSELSIKPTTIRHFKSTINKQVIVCNFKKII